MNGTGGFTAGGGAALSRVLGGVPPEGLIVRKGETAYTPPFPRGGSQAVLGFDLLERTASAILAVEIQHKNSADTSWTSVGAFGSTSTTGLKSAHVSQLKEQVRLEFEVTGGLNWDERVRVKLLAPSWQF